MKAKEDGTLKVPEEIVKEWRNGNQQKLLEDFKEAGLDKDLDPCYPLAVASQSGFPISKTDVIWPFLHWGLVFFGSIKDATKKDQGKMEWLQPQCWGWGSHLEESQLWGQWVVFVWDKYIISSIYKNILFLSYIAPGV